MMKQVLVIMTSLVGAIILLAGCSHNPEIEVYSAPPAASAIGKPRDSGPMVTDLGDGVTLELVQIPGGSFSMGSPLTETGRSSDEGPAHQVTLDGFWLGKYEITQEQWRAVMGNNPSSFVGSKNPVDQVTWDQSNEFCHKLSEKTGRTITLPTEAQWEYACRAGTQTVFHTGDNISTSEANFHGHYPYGNGVPGEYREKTLPVGSFLPNSFGLYDMHGNVWEWCMDRYQPEYYGKPEASEKNPANISSGAMCVLRGGSWQSAPRLCRSAVRHYIHPDQTNNMVGFRVVCNE